RTCPWLLYSAPSALRDVLRFAPHLPLAFIFRAFGASRRAPLRSALAPGFYIPRLRRFATCSASLRTCPWLLYSAPSALRDVLRFAAHLPLAFIFRAFGASRRAPLRCALAPGFYIPRLRRFATCSASLRTCPWLLYSA